jgi:hypothetical protein
LVFRYLQLRGSVLFNATEDVVLQPGQPATVIAPLNVVTAAVSDIEMTVSSNPGSQVSIGVRCESATSCRQGAVVNATSSSGSLSGTFVAMGGRPTAFSFPMLNREASWPLRIMSDINTVEIFVGGGRAVYSTGIGTSDGGLVTAVATGVASTITAATGWAMASIRAQ